MINRLLAALSCTLLAVSAGAAVQPPSAELAALVARARPGSSVLSWCRGELRTGQRDSYAAAIAGAASGGSYLAFDQDGTASELARFTGQPDLSCYTPAEAQRLHTTIGQSATIHGRIAPRWPSTVVCGFVDNTTAVCWQYSPVDRRFVEIGGWLT